MKELKFIHITKTAGTSIEIVGKFQNNLNWGFFHKEYSYHHHVPFLFINENIKSKYDWFTVVRNPYERIISEFYCKWIPPKTNQNQYSKEEFNQITQENILNHHVKNQVYGFHYTPQYKYIDTNYNIYILKFEELPNNFNALMKKYNLNLELNIKENQGVKKFNVEDLNHKTINLINKIYYMDFLCFNYKMIQLNS